MLEADKAVAIGLIANELATNAFKYAFSDQGGEIYLALKFVEKSKLLLTLCDNGIGIDSKDQDRIFERFERVVGGAPKSGFGIGLWLVRNLVESMGGSITVLGKSGEGSCFTVTLPLKPREHR